MNILLHASVDLLKVYVKGMLLIVTNIINHPAVESIILETKEISRW